MKTPQANRAIIASLVVLAALAVLASANSGQPKVVEDALGGRRLVAMSEHDRVWLAPAQIEQLIANKVHFMDITDHPDLAPVPELVSKTLPDHLQLRHATEDIEKLLKDISPAEIANTITELSSLNTRYYNTQTGIDGARLLYQKYTDFGLGQAHVSVRFFDHSWPQPSVIARIEGTGPNTEEIVIIGGHEDSISFSSTGRAPGADDDASGSASVLEVFRVLVKNGFRGRRSIEFHAYAAEEVGLRGSQDIASAYQKEGRIVAGMMQLDMVGYIHKDEPVYAIVTDFVSPTLTQFVRQLASTYSDLPVKDTKCGYACSDHASWTRAGYPSTFPFETVFAQLNPHIHSPEDTLDKISPEHASKYAKVALAFAVELSDQ